MGDPALDCRCGESKAKEGLWSIKLPPLWMERRNRNGAPVQSENGHKQS